MYRMFFVIKHSGARHFTGKPLATVADALALFNRLNDNPCKGLDYGFTVSSWPVK